MSWRETLGVTPSAETPYTHNSQNTQKPTEPVNCADIADIAYRDTDNEAEPPELPEPPLSPDEEKRIRAWLDYIEEDDQEILEEVLVKCRRDTDARQYFLKRSEEVTEPVERGGEAEQRSSSCRVICGDCAHYRRTDHPHLGHCARGEQENVAGLWDSDRRYCMAYQK